MPPFSSVLCSIWIRLIAMAGTLILADKSACADVSILKDGSAKDSPATILIHSEIKKGDFAAFTKAADSIKLTTRNAVNGVPLIIVELDSPGGDVLEATQIGRLVHAHFMFTRVKQKRECASACVFILIAGADRSLSDEARVGLHRPRFDHTYFANLTAEQARAKYNALVEDLRNYFNEMGGNVDAFRLMLSVPSDELRFLSPVEFDKFGLRGVDPAWEELSDAKFVEIYGAVRWPLIRKCASTSGDLNACVKKAYERYPND